MNRRVLFFLTSAFIMASCNQSGNHQHHRAHDHNQQAEMKIQAVAPSELSVYNAASSWQTQNGDTIKLKDLQGKIQVIAMMYSSCQYTCPRIIADIKTVETALAGSDEKIGFVLVSIDPKRDTPQKLKSFARQYNLGSEWLLLHGSEPDVRELSALLGVQYKQTSATEFSHSNILTVLNGKGEIIHQQIGLGVHAEETIAVIKKVLRAGA